jgi:hypothetical protein
MQSCVAGLSLIQGSFDQLNGLVLGLGGGALVGYLLHNFENLSITAVDLDSEMI